MKIRMKFAKHGVMKYIGHLDIMRFFQKVMRRADIAIFVTVMMTFQNLIGAPIASVCLSKEADRFIAKGGMTTEVDTVKGADDKKKKFGDELSKGMQQKLSICCGLLPKPKLILFDEPMIGLDPHAIKELKSLLLELKQQGASVLVSTHMIDSIEELWDTTYIMMKGRVAAVVERDKVGEGDKSLEDIFFEITEGGAV